MIRLAGSAGTLAAPLAGFACMLAALLAGSARKLAAPLLTKRRAVDLCRVAASLCPAS